MTCPAGSTASFTVKTRTAQFGIACAACPFRDRCTTAAAGRSVTVNVHDKIQRAHRARWNTDPQMRADYKKHRPMVERSIAWLTRGARRLRYRGVTKNDAWLKLRASGIGWSRDWGGHPGAWPRWSSGDGLPGVGGGGGPGETYRVS